MPFVGIGTGFQRLQRAATYIIQFDPQSNSAKHTGNSYYDDRFKMRKPRTKNHRAPDKDLINSKWQYLTLISIQCISH